MRPLNRRGVALMLVLWLLVLLGAVAAGVAESSRAEAGVVANLKARAAARSGAESGIAATTSRIERLLAAARTPQNAALLFREIDRHFSGMREVAVGDARFGVAVVDLNARIDLNQADEATLRNFVAQFTDETRATRIVAALEDWEDADDLTRPNGAEATDYARAGSPYAPRNGPLQRLDDFAHVLGVTDSLALTLAPYITVEGDRRVNINTAPEPVLASLPGIGPAGARTLIARRDGGETFTSTAVVEDLLRGGAVAVRAALSRTAIMPSRILIVSRGWRAGSPLTHEIEAVYAIGGGRLALQSWRERDL